MRWRTAVHGSLLWQHRPLLRGQVRGMRNLRGRNLRAHQSTTALHGVGRLPGLRLVEHLRPLPDLLK